MAILPRLNLLKLSWSMLLKLRAWSGALIAGGKLGLGLHHLFDLLGDPPVLALLTDQGLVLVIVGHGNILAIAQPLEQASLEKMFQGLVHFVLVQELILHLLHSMLHCGMLLQLLSDLGLLELFLDLVFLDLLLGSASLGIGFKQNRKIRVWRSASKEYLLFMRLWLFPLRTDTAWLFL